MKFLYTLIAFLFCFTMTAQQPFVTTWEVTAGDLQIVIPTDSFSNYDYTVDFGDGTTLTNRIDDTSHTYLSPGIYTVSISGDFPAIYFGKTTFQDADKLLSIEQWGNIEWKSMFEAFKGCSNLTINASDTPDLNNVPNLIYTFQGAGINENINNWDVSNVEFMIGLFENAVDFNQPLDNWDVSNVTLMSGMFTSALDFNQPLNNWDVSNVINMSGMFKNTANFNQPLNNWDVSSVEKMGFMFGNTYEFNQPLDNWNISNVTDMGGMFSGAKKFNQSLNNWDVSNVEFMDGLFKFTDEFNQPLNNWDVSNVKFMDEMFKGANKFNQPIETWNVSNVSNMDEMFRSTPYFNQPLNNWDTSNVTSMFGMFRSANSFNQQIENWDVSSVTNMAHMFRNATSFNQPLNNWDVSNLNFTAGMFENATAFNQPLNNWDVSSCSNYNRTFYNASSFNQDLSSWNFNSGLLNDMLSNSGLSLVNYDLLLDKLFQLGIENGQLGADNISYCNAFTRQQLISDLNWGISGDSLASDCDLNYVSGVVKYDLNNDGCDDNDQDISNILVNIFNGQDDIAVSTNDDGEFVMALDQGNYTVEILNIENYFNVSPNSHSLSFNGTSSTVTDIDFCITSNQNVQDLSINILPIGSVKPGFETNYLVFVNNNGTENVPNVQVSFNYDSNLQSFVSSTETPSSNTTDLLTFDLIDLQAFTNKTFLISMLNAVPPTLNGGEVLTFTSQVTPDANDANIGDNSVSFDQTVVNSFDPNDKLVIQGDEIADEDKDQYLDYRIRFQNVGTANAINVTITDTISDKLDWTTFQPITSSHNYRVELIDQEEINFYFDNINLPFESADPEGSNGYITYKIKPKDNVQIGDIIENKAYIFFDFNAPIITNTVSTEIVDELSTTSFVQPENIKLSPNPAEDRVEIINESNATIKSVKLYSIKGQLINTFTDKSLIDISQLSSGVYILQVETRNNKINKRLIKR